MDNIYSPENIERGRRQLERGATLLRARGATQGTERTMDNIYSPENIERSRGRARDIRHKVAHGLLSQDWLTAADEVDAYAKERELLAAIVVPVDPADETNCESCQ